MGFRTLVLEVIELGEWLRQRYVDQFGLLARNYNSSEVLVQSSQYDRAMQTANLVLSGLFSNGSEGLRVPVFTTPRANDVLLRGYDICGGGRKRVMEQLVQSDVWTTKQQLSQEFFSWFMNVTGFTSINFVEFTSLYFDPVFVMYAHALLPAEIAIRIDEIIELADWVKWNKIHALGSLTAGTLLQQIVSNVDTAMNSSIASPKFIQYSAHDYTMMSLAATMELDSNPLFQKIPDYASAMVLELWAAEAKSSVNNNNDNTRLVMYYRDGVSGNVTGAVMNVSVAELHALNIRRGFQMQGWCDACANWTSVSVMPEPCLRISRSISTPTPTPTPTFQTPTRTPMPTPKRLQTPAPHPAPSTPTLFTPSASTPSATTPGEKRKKRQLENGNGLGHGVEN
eukprot:c12417_g1_i3.p1 GENE.c12417_g1_i3~~c12417_g1_i3.p1  ORF type:complete len:397 (-),score=80.88 c12417_g1_i3:112-1302(-)